MNKISLNFVAPRSPRWPLALFVGTALIAWSAWISYGQTRERIDALSSSGSAGSERERRKSAESGLPADLPVKMAKAQQILGQLTRPWDDLFMQLEAVKAEGVTLLSLEPDADRGNISLGGEAVDIAAMLNYVAKLEKAQALSKVHLQRHEIMSNEAARPIRFTVGADWKISP